MDDVTFNYTDPNASDEFLRSWRSMIEYYDENRILLPESIEQIFDKFHKTAFFASTDYRNAQKLLDRQHISNVQLENLLKKQDRALANLDQIPILRDELKRSLRKILGVYETS